MIEGLGGVSADYSAETVPHVSSGEVLPSKVLWFCDHLAWRAPVRNEKPCDVVAFPIAQNNLWERHRQTRRFQFIVRRLERDIARELRALA